jgi:outer membrane lipoprotein-sorting protein
MKKNIFAAMLAAALLSAEVFGADASAIIRAIDDNLTFDEGVMKASMIDKKAGGATKSFDMEIRYKKGAGTLMEFRSPARERGKKVLLAGDNMWMYVPGLSRPVRLSGRDSFMGTSFSNRDLMDYEMDNDYDSVIVSENDSEYKIELKATNKNVSYPRILMWVDKSRMLPTKQELYTISGNLIKTMTFSDVKNFAGKDRPSVMAISDVLSAGSETRVIISHMNDEKIPASAFSPQNLAR